MATGRCRDGNCVTKISITRLHPVPFFHRNSCVGVYKNVLSAAFQVAREFLLLHRAEAQGLRESEINSINSMLLSACRPLALQRAAGLALGRHTHRRRQLAIVSATEQSGREAMHVVRREFARDCVSQDVHIHHANWGGSRQLTLEASQMSVTCGILQGINIVMRSPARFFCSSNQARRMRLLNHPALQAVIGAGAAGLVAARELLAEGHSVRVLEQAARPGGVWVLDDKTEADDPLGLRSDRNTVHSSMYDKCAPHFNPHTITATYQSALRADLQAYSMMMTITRLAAASVCCDVRQLVFGAL